jgi:hypothetical protein
MRKRGTRLQVPAFDPRWVPGTGPEPAALALLHEHWNRRPRRAMGEAWFLGGQEIFEYLLEVEPAGLSTEQRYDVLRSIGSGTSSFGPLLEWQEWFRYLLPRLIVVAPAGLRKDHQELTGLLVTALVSQFPAALDDPTVPLRELVLATLGRTIMAPANWHDGRMRLGLLTRPQPRGWATGDVSASICLMLKYLHADEIDAWVESVMAIGDAHWRAFVLIWLVGARYLLENPAAQPGDDEMQGTEPAIWWDEAHVLKGRFTGDHCSPDAPIPFIPPANACAFRRIVRRRMTSGRCEEWLASIAADPLLGEDHETLYWCEQAPGVVHGWV